MAARRPSSNPHVIVEQCQCLSKGGSACFHHGFSGDCWSALHASVRHSSRRSECRVCPCGSGLHSLYGVDASSWTFHRADDHPPPPPPPPPCARRLCLQIAHHNRLGSCQVDISGSGSMFWRSSPAPGRFTVHHLVLWSFLVVLSSTGGPPLLPTAMLAAAHDSSVLLACSAVQLANGGAPYQTSVMSACVAFNECDHSRCE